MGSVALAALACLLCCSRHALPLLDTVASNVVVLPGACVQAPLLRTERARRDWLEKELEVRTASAPHACMLPLKWRDHQLDISVNTAYTRGIKPYWLSACSGS